MYEATISVPKGTEHLLAYVKKQTLLPLVEMGGIFTDLQDGRRLYFSVACSDTFRFQLRRLLQNSVAETVALGYKNIFVRQCLHIENGNFFQNVLINTMCVFDKSYDQQSIVKILDVDKPIFIDGYCNFKLDLLKRKWQEIAKLVAENNFILYDKQLILEFLQYLLESVSSKVSHLSVSLEKDAYYLFDSKNNVVPKICSLSKNSSVEEEAALNILFLKPKKLTVYFAETPTDGFGEIVRLFNGKTVQVN